MGFLTQAQLRPAQNINEIRNLNFLRNQNNLLANSTKV